MMFGKEGGEHLGSALDCSVTAALPQDKVELVSVSARLCVVISMHGACVKATHAHRGTVTFLCPSNCQKYHYQKAIRLNVSH